MAVDREHTAAPADAERMAAFTIQVQLSTRVGVRTLGRDDGILREALTSLHAMFEITRAALEEFGLAAGRASAVGALADRMLDDVLRPFLDRWHPMLAAHESRRPDGIDPVTHERAWPQREEFRAELRALSGPLTEINGRLADISGTDLEPALSRGGEDGSAGE